MENLSLYIHIPFCVKKCFYCDFLSAPQREETREQYVEALCNEIKMASPEYRDFQVVSVFIGGGTPSVLQPEQTTRIMESIRSNYQLLPDCEISMEMNPGTVTPEKMKAYRFCGINRISIGLQSANDEELKALGRIHSYAEFLEAYQMAIDAGFTNINVDLMSAIPLQTMESYTETLHKVLSLEPQPQHISAYSLIVEEGTPFYGQELPLPDEETERKMYEITDVILKRAGYHRYEISNYAKDGRECRHNKVYWQRGNYLGFGIGSASLIHNVRFRNTTDILDYIQIMREKSLPSVISSKTDAEATSEDGLSALREDVENLSMSEQMEEFMFLGLRMMEGVSEKKFCENFGKRFSEVYPDVISKYEKMGLLQVLREEDSDQGTCRYAEERENFVHLRLTSRGIDVSNQIFVDFMEPEGV